VIFNISESDDLKATCQALLQARGHVRSVESLVDSLLPMTTDSKTQEKLQMVRSHAALIAELLLELYGEVAPEAFK
jgi:hypothetical protein